VTEAGGAVQLVPVLENHRFDEQALAVYLSDHLDGFSGNCTIRQFQGGQSNPTFHLQSGDRSFVLRKKPPGKLLPSAHAIEREYKVMRALAATDVPVPEMHLLCTDEDIIGQAFFVMEHIEGRVFADRILDSCDVAERSAIYDDMNRILAALHLVDYRDVQLEGFGRPEGYITRQIARWSKQYAATKLVDLPAMDHLMNWLPENAPDRDETAIAHGDFRLGNLVIHPTEAKVVAVLDWELSTIGHPLADLAYNCLAYRLPHAGGRGFGDVDIASLGIPREAEYVSAYCQRTNRAQIEDWTFYLILAMFRIVAIMVGVHRRAVDGNAADAQALEIANFYPAISERAWAIASDNR